MIYSHFDNVVIVAARDEHGMYNIYYLKDEEDASDAAVFAECFPPA
jgi:hypothetical protein